MRCTNWGKKLWIYRKTIDAHIVDSSRGLSLFSLAKQFVELSLLYPSTGAGNVMFPFSFAIRFNLAFSPQAASSIFHLPLSSPPVFPSISLCPYSITSYLFHHLTMVLSSMHWDKSLTSGQINSFPSIYMGHTVTLHIANIWLQSSITLGDALSNLLAPPPSKIAAYSWAFPKGTNHAHVAWTCQLQCALWLDVYMC